MDYKDTGTHFKNKVWILLLTGRSSSLQNRDLRLDWRICCSFPFMSFGDFVYIWLFSGHLFHESLIDKNNTQNLCLIMEGQGWKDGAFLMVLMLPGAQLWVFWPPLSPEAGVPCLSHRAWSRPTGASSAVSQAGPVWPAGHSKHWRVSAGADGPRLLPDIHIQINFICPFQVFSL